MSTPNKIPQVPGRKARSDSAFKTLPESRQAEIADYLRANSLAATVAWLKDDGIKTSASALSEFLSWYSLRLQFRQDEQTTETLLEQLKAEVPGLTDEQLDELGQRTFSLLAIRNQDADSFVNVRSAMTRAKLEAAKLKLREEKLKQDERKIVLMEKKSAAYDRAQAALTEAKNSKGGLTPETLARIEQELRLL